MTNDEPKSLNNPPLHLASSAAKRSARPSERRKKIISFEEVGPLMADALRHDRTLCLGGLFKQNRPVALVRELIRRGIGELGERPSARLISPGHIGRTSVTSGMK